MEVIDRILEVAKGKGVTNTFICSALGLSRGYLSDVKNGKNTMSEDRVVAIAEILNVSTDYLLGKTENPTTTNDSEVGALQDPVTAEILDIMRKLSPNGQDLVLSHIRSVADFEHKKDN